jgi:hypothetical protein
MVCANVAGLANHVDRRDSSWLVLPVDDVILPPEQNVPTIRVHARVMLSSTYRSIWQFGDLRGLLLVMCDVVNGKWS